MNFLFAKIFLLLFLLTGNSYLQAQQSIARTRIGERIAQAGLALRTQFVPAAILVAGLGVASAIPSAYAQHENNAVMEEEANAWQIVDDQSSAHQKSVFNLYVDSVYVAEDGKKYDLELLFPMGYLGTDDQGRAVFVGRTGVGSFFVTQLAETGRSNLISYRGLVAENVVVEELDVLEDQLDNVLSMVVIAVSGADLGNEYEPLLIGSYPFREETALGLVSYYRQTHSPILYEVEGAADKIPLRVRECNSVPDANWGKAGIGLHSCDGAGGDGIAHGALLFLDGKLVALQSRPLEDGVAMSVEINQQLRQFTHNLRRGGAYAVDARDKAATTWGAIKAGNR